MSQKDDSLFIRHILESIDAIEEFSKNISKEELILNRMKQSAIVREIEIIGEAAKNISEVFKSQHKEIPWKEIVGTRDKMIHHYFGVDMNVVWYIIKIDLPDLRKNLERIK